MAAPMVSGGKLVAMLVVLVVIVGTGLWYALDRARHDFRQSVDEARRAVEQLGGAEAWLRVELDTGEGGWLPFFVKIPPEGERATIRNAGEDIEAALMRFDDAFFLDFPHYDAKLTLEPAGGDDWTGVYIKTRPGGDIAEMAARAARIDAPDPAERFAGLGDVGTVLDLTGEWRVEFDSGEIAKGIFAQDGGVLTGTILTPTGDYRYLAGNVGERLMALSVFDGAHAFLFKAAWGGALGELVGEFHSGNHYTDGFTALRVPEGETFELPDPFDAVALVPGETRLRLERLDSAPYAGAPTIVTVFGTWCPNCHDEAPVLKRLYDEHNGQGLQMLGLAYEHTDDEARSRRLIERFRQRYGIGWEIIPAGLSDKARTAATLPALTDIKSYPTTIFINADGTVRAIHSGFAGPATGEAHERLVAEFERLTREIVATGG